LVWHFHSPQAVLPFAGCGIWIYLRNSAVLHTIVGLLEKGGLQ
jgi:hypothetical protein